MADYNVLKSSVAAVIKTNNRREITGQLLQNVLTQMINVIGENYQLAGFADPTTNPQSPDQNVFYVAEQSGVYPYFDNIIVPEGVTFLMWKNSQWTAHTIGVVTTEYLSENYVTKEFFRSMFRAYDSHGVEIEPNNDGDEPYTIDNIKAMVGFWTNEYISALGQGSGGGGGGGSTSLAGLTDVAINPQTLAGGQALVYNGTTYKWENGSAVINMASVWSALGASTNEQINASHLSAALQGFATQEWVGQNYISIAYFDRLFRAYNGNTLVSHNDETSTIDNIKAMFGFWTEQYLSALGNSGGGSVSLTLANMGDVSLNNLADGQILVYYATEGEWVNTSASIVGNYLPITGGTLTGDLFFDGYNNRVFGIKRTSASAQDVINNINIGWDWTNRDGAGAFFRSSEAGVNAGDFGFFARNATQNCELLGKPDGTLTWDNSPILTSANVKTINGESIYGTGNIVVGGGGSAYLPLAGGTMTGNINLASGAYIYADSVAFIACAPTNWSSVTSSQWAVGAIRYQGMLRSSASDLLHWRGGASGQAYAILDEYNATTILNGSYLPLTGGSVSGNITPSANASYNLGSSSLWWNRLYTRYIDTASGYNLRLCTAGTERLSITASSGNVGIGITSPNYKLHVNGTLGAGNTSVANLESEGYVSALSDIRKKKVMEYMDGLTIEQIASMPIIKFTWRDRPEEGLQVGSVAQEWQKILPQSVHNSKDDYLSFSYGVAALVSSISTARKVVDHEKRIAELERENKELKLKLNIA